jgi:hypothetical protein
VPSVARRRLVGLPKGLEPGHRDVPTHLLHANARAPAESGDPRRPCNAL